MIYRNYLYDEILNTYVAKCFFLSYLFEMQLKQYLYSLKFENWCCRKYNFLEFVRSWRHFFNILFSVYHARKPDNVAQLMHYKNYGQINK